MTTHGPTGGWHPDDHKTFMEVLKACKGDYHSAALQCIDAMFGYTKADIIQHARWHADYMDLQASGCAFEGNQGASAL